MVYFMENLIKIDDLGGLNTHLGRGGITALRPEKDSWCKNNEKIECLAHLLDV